VLTSDEAGVIIIAPLKETDNLLLNMRHVGMKHHNFFTMGNFTSTSITIIFILRIKVSFMHKLNS
jgi:hypothetical protein